MHFSAKKFFLIGFIIILLVGIPLSVYFLQQQQITQQQAEKSTNFSFEPPSSESSPIKKNIGDQVVLDVIVTPGNNIVSSINVELNYNSNILEAVPDAFKTEESIFPVYLTKPIYEPAGTIIATIGVNSPANALKTKAKVATVTFKAIAATNGTPTKVTYTSKSNATSRGPNDQALEDVLLGTQPAYIEIEGEPEPSATPTNTPGPTSTPGPSNNPPICSALTVDQTSGAAPLAVSFTSTGTDSDGTISKVTFNFGDGQVSDVTSGGGIGTGSVSAQIAHTYTSAGTFQATAIITDDTNGISSTTNCSQSISVSGGGGGAPPAQVTATPTPPIAPSGSTEVLFGIGAASILLILGGLVFLAL